MATDENTSAQTTVMSNSPPNLRNEEPIDTAPLDGTEIEVLEDGEWQPAMWSERPVCMLGPTAYWPPGWVTSPACNTDCNLPMDISPTHWRPL